MPEDNIEAVEAIMGVLQDNFLEGSFQNQVIKTEDMGKFDAETVTVCFGRLTGQEPDPKV